MSHTSLPMSPSVFWLVGLIQEKHCISSLSASISRSPGLFLAPGGSPESLVEPQIVPA